MTIFSSLSKLLKGPVGNNLANDPDDVKTVKSHLQKIGLMEDLQDNHGYITRDLDTGIRAFQTQHGLRIDGLLYPGGETEHRLLLAQAKASIAPVPVHKPTPPPPVPKIKPEQVKHTINTFFPDLSKKEGGQTSGTSSLNAIDKRGATNIGITKSTLLDFEKKLKSQNQSLPPNFTTDVDKVTPDLARQIYDEMYYKKYNINKVADQNTAHHLMDISVLNGPDKAGRWYQEALNKELGTKLKVDGTIGPEVRTAIAEAKREGVLYKINNDVVQKRKAAFIDIAKDPTQKGFLNGWLARADSFKSPPIPSRKP